MNITTIYNDYLIMPSLQLHMYRVAGVAQLIVKHLSNEIDDKNVISACLLHDMGNILKFKLDVFPEFLQPEGFDYWHTVQNQYREKYGENEHEATLAIAREIKVSKRTYELMSAVEFSKAELNYQSADIARKICAYADMRVQPFGVTSLQARLEDGRKRFQVRKSQLYDTDRFNVQESYLKKIEAQIFLHCSIDPLDITEKSIQKLIPALQLFEVI